MKSFVYAVALSLALAGPALANCGNGNGNGNGCSGEQGPQGPEGPQGPAGSDGQDGLNGTNGKDGVKGDKGDTGAPADTSAKLVLDTAVRLYDGKRLQLQLFNVYALDRHVGHDVLGGARNHMFGARIVLKLGTSYEERQIAKQQKEIDALKRLLHAK